MVIHTPLMPIFDAKMKRIGGISMIPLMSEMINEGLAFAFAEK